MIVIARTRQKDNRSHSTAPGTRIPSATHRTIESADESEIGPTWKAYGGYLAEHQHQPTAGTQLLLIDNDPAPSPTQPD